MPTHRTRRSFAPSIVAVSVALLTACATVGPEYERPGVDLPNAYRATIPVLFQDAAPVDRWWKLLDDEQLDRLIQRGLIDNLDLRAATSRVLEARALARGVAARARPSVSAGGSLGTDWIRDLDNNNTRTARSADAFVEGVWEVDLFGRLRRSREAAWAEAERQEALRREVARVTTREIAVTYVDLRAAERRLALTEESLALQRRTLDLVRTRVDAGLAPGLDRVRAEAAVANLEATVGPLQSRIENLRNALAVRLGEPPGALARLLAPAAPIPKAQTGTAIGMPLDLLRRRPDVQAAELMIVAATAEVGIQTADLYPRLTLPGVISVGYTTAQFTPAVRSVLASLSLLLDVPLYDAGERRANVEAADQRVVQSALLYRDTVLQAMREVEAALFGYRGSRERRDALVAAVKNNRLAYEQSQHLYRQGFVTFLDVLDSQRAWNSSLQDLATAERDLTVEVINLYSALGGEDVEKDLPDIAKPFATGARDD